MSYINIYMYKYIYIYLFIYIHIYIIYIISHIYIYIYIFIYMMLYTSGSSSRCILFHGREVYFCDEVFFRINSGFIGEQYAVH